ncbi:MAG: DMT family transporter [Pseudomonadota bacterium]
MPLAQAKPTGPSSAATMLSISLMIMAVALFSLLDAMGKHLGASLPILQVAWVRFATHLLFCFAFLQLWRHPGRLKTDRPWLQITRGLLLLGTTVFNFFALQHLQLAETASIMFSAPIVVAALAVPLLGEHVGVRRWAAIAVGFIGVLIVTRPGLDGLGWPALIAVASMTCFAFYSLTTRLLATGQDAASLVFYSAAVPAIVIMPIGIFVWVWPTDGLTWLILLSTGLVGGVGHWLLVKAHQRADASTLSPFIYTQIVWMIGLGWLWFGDIPTSWTLIGAAIIIGSGLYILYRETIVGRRPPASNASKEISS